MHIHFNLDFCNNYHMCMLVDTHTYQQYGTRHIIEAMNKSGHDIKVILVCGGVSKNRLYRQIHADVTGRKIKIELVVIKVC